jgi:hypothetical protein
VNEMGLDLEVLVLRVLRGILDHEMFGKSSVCIILFIEQKDLLLRLIGDFEHVSRHQYNQQTAASTENHQHQGRRTSNTPR